MNKLLQWITKNVVDGANVEEAEKLIKDIEDTNPLNSIKTAEEALAFIQRNKDFKSALDSETSKRVEHAIDKFKETKVPELVKAEEERIRKELEPNETEAQKVAREFKEYKEGIQKKESQQELKQTLRGRAAEIAKEAGIQYDPLRAEKYYIYGDKAEEMLSDDIQYWKGNIDSVLETKLKGQFTTTQLKTGETETGSLDERIAASKKAGNLNLTSKLLIEKQQQGQ